MKVKISCSKCCLSVAIAIALGQPLRVFAQDSTTAAASLPAGAPGASTTSSSADTLSDASSSAEATSSSPMDSVSPNTDTDTGSIVPAKGMSGNLLNYQADLFTGRFTYAVPIAVAPGRQGAEPKLTLGYNSAGGNSWCGVGWGLDVGYIQRDTRHGVPILWDTANALAQYDDSKGFVANIAGTMGTLVRVSGTNQNPIVYRQQVDTAFLTYNYYTNDNHWEVLDKSGNTFYFGEGITNQMENPKTNWIQGVGSSTFRWALNRVVDVNGNETFLSYTTDGGMLYLTNISYNANLNSPALPATDSVSFILADRPDTNITYISGFRVQMQRLLSEIDVKAGGSNVRKYVLSYATSPSTFRSLLTAVTQYGSDFSTALPPITFNYQEKPFTFSADTNWPTLHDSADSRPRSVYNVRCVNGRDGNPTYYTRVENIDIDGDGLPDRVMLENTNAMRTGALYFLAQRNTSTNFNATEYQWKMPGGNIWPIVPTNSSTAVDINSQTFVSLIDINGDGYPDRILWLQDYLPEHQHQPVTNYCVQLNSGIEGTNGSVGFAPSVFWTNALGSIKRDTYHDFMDMNGDGLPDRVCNESSSPFDRFLVQFNTGGGFTMPANWLSLDSQGQTGADWNSVSQKDAYGNREVILADINGDGLPDRIMRMVNPPYTNFVVQLNNGAGFEPAENWGPLDSQGETNMNWNSPIGTDGVNVQTSLIDINGDGLLDRIMESTNSTVTNWWVQLNTGSGFAPAASWGPIDSNPEISATTEFQHINTITFADLFDINGDGLPDRVTSTSINGASYNYLTVQLNQGPFPDLLNVVSNSLGGSVQVTYVASTTLDNRNTNWVSDPWAEGTKSLLPFNVWVVSQITASDGLGNSSTNSYAFKGGYYNAPEREFRGFSQCTVTDPLGAKTVTYFHQSGGRDNSALGEYLDQGSESKKGIPYRIEVIGSDGATNKITLNKVEEVELNSNDWYFPFVSQSIVMDYEGLSSYRATAKQFNYDTNTENLVEEADLGEVENVVINGQTFTDAGSDSVYTWMTYTNRGRPSDIKITSDSAGNNRLRESKMFYDSRGNLTGNQVWLDTAGSFITTTSTLYDQYGNPYSATDAAGITTTTTYDPTYQQYPIQQVTATFTNQFAYDPRSGLTVQAIDAKGLVASNAFDVFYRSTATYISTNAYGPPVLWKTKTSYALGGISGGISYNCVHKQVNDATDDNGFETYTYLDGIGRTIQTRAEAETGQFRVANVCYDLRGNAYFQTLPYFSSGSDFTSISGNYLGTLTEFDSVGRAFRVTPAVQGTFGNGSLTATTATGGDTGSPVGAITTAFVDGGNPWATVVTDSESKVKKSCRDAYGRTIQITEVTSAGDYNTTYIYDLLGNLTNVTDSANNKTSMSYDSLARKTAMTDPDMGTWSYAYDNAGRMTQQIDARNDKITFDYTDPLGRLVAKHIYNSSGALAGTITYTYDTSDDPNYTVFKGQLYKVTDLQGWQRSSYDVRGRVLKTGRFLNANAMEYVTQTTYDDADRVRTLTCPGNAAVIQYSYDTAGNLDQVKSLAGTGTQEIFYVPLGFNALGQLTGYIDGASVTTANTYYDNSKRLQRVWVHKGVTNYQDLTYTYDTVSDIKSITDAVNTGGASASISAVAYDDLYRVTLVNSTARGIKKYAYNPIGNIITNQDFGSGIYQYGSRPHAVTSANGKSYAYDACGNMTTRGSQTLVYDEQNELVRVFSTGTNVTFGYDAGGERLWRSGTNGYSIWIGGIYEINNGKVLCHVFAGGKRLATFEPQCNAGLSKIIGEKNWYVASTKLNSIMSWPFQNGRGKMTMFAGTWIAILGVCAVAGRGEKRTSRRSSRRSQKSRRFKPSRWHQFLVLLSLSAFLWSSTPEALAAPVYSPVFYYYHNDNLRSSNVLTDRSGEMVQHYEYATFGQTSFQNNIAAYQVSNRYTGQICDDETGLYYYGARYYDAQLGRFIQSDTVVASADPQVLNHYAYCGNNPLKYIDPNGQIFGIDDIVIGIIIGAAIGGATAAATGGNIGMGILTGAIGGLFGGLGAWAGSLSPVTAALGSVGGPLAGAIIGGTTGGAICAAVSGGDVGMGALIGSIAGGIGFGIGWFNHEVLKDLLSNFSVSVIGGALGGGVGAVMQGGDFWEGAAYGAAGAAGAFGLYALATAPWGDLKGQIRAAADKDMDAARADGLDPQINDNKYGHASNTSAAQRLLGILASPFLTAYGVGYEAWHAFFPGHTDYHSAYEDLKIDRSKFTFKGLFDGQHPLNWLWDTPGDMMGNIIGQFSGLFLSPSAGAQFNRAGFLIPGPDYTHGPSNSSTWEKFAAPGVRWPW